MVGFKHSPKLEAVKLRKEGKTYGEIQNILNVKIPKSTLSNWCKDISLSFQHKLRIDKCILESAKKGRAIALAVNRARREDYLKSIEKRVSYLGRLMKDKDIAKISLAMLYLGEGSKGYRKSLMLGNSDPETISLFLKLFRYCYTINESKFRCTLQCRADQNIIKLETFWSEITKIPLTQFYRARIDPRTIGKKSKKPYYKGVCRIDYFSADILNEILKIVELLKKGI